MKKKHTLAFILVAAFIVAFLILLPFIANWIYSLKSPNNFFITDLKLSDFLVYYASALSFLGSLILGVLTLVQNKRAQDKTDEINRLQLELQKKSMVLAEEGYQQENETEKPKFEISVSGYSGCYLNPRIRLKNVSLMMISTLTLLSGYVRDNEKKTIRETTGNKFQSRSLAPNAETILDLKMTGLSTRISDREYQYFKNVDFVLEFSCEDEKYQTHYFRAILHIPSTKDFVSDLWNVEKVG